MFPPRHAAGPGCRAMRMAVMTGDRDRNATPMSLALLAVCFAALSASRALRHATKARHVTLHIEFDTEQPTETMPDAGSPAHLFLYAASAYAIYNLVSSTMRDPLSWWNPPAIGGPHSREVAGRAAARAAPGGFPATVPNAPPPPRNRCAVGALEWRCKRGYTRANAADHATTATAPVQGKTTTQTPTSTPPASPPTTHAAPPHSGGHHHAPPTNLYFDERMGGLWAGAPPTARAQTREGARAGR